MFTRIIADDCNAAQSTSDTRDAPVPVHPACAQSFSALTAPRSFAATIAYLQEGFAEYEAMNWRIKTTLQSLSAPGDALSQRGEDCAPCSPLAQRRLALAGEFNILMTGVEQGVSRASALQMQLITVASLSIFDSRQRLSNALESWGQGDFYPPSEKTRLAQLAIRACTVETEQLTIYIERGIEALTALARSTGGGVLNALSLH